MRLEWRQGEDGRWSRQEIAGSEAVLPAERMLLALGFVHPVHAVILTQLGAALDAQGNVRANTDNYQTSLNPVFSAGDMRRGQSLVVWAIHEGRQCAWAVDEFLMGGSECGIPDTVASYLIGYGRGAWKPVVYCSLNHLRSQQIGWNEPHVFPCFSNIFSGSVRSARGHSQRTAAHERMGQCECHGSGLAIKQPS